MYSVTTTKTAAAQQYSTSIQTPGNPPKITTASEYFSSESESRPTIRAPVQLSGSYKYEPQFQQQQLYSSQNQVPVLQQERFYEEEMQQLNQRPLSATSPTQPSLGQARQVSMTRETEYGYNKTPTPLANSFSSRQSRLQSSMKKAASVLPPFQSNSQIYSTGTAPAQQTFRNFPTEQKKTSLDCSGSSSVQELNVAQNRSSAQMPVYLVEQPKPKWPTFLAKRNGNSSGPRITKQGPNPFFMCCFALMAGVVLLIFICLLVLLIARMQVRNEPHVGGYNGYGYGNGYGIGNGYGNGNGGFFG